MSQELEVQATRIFYINKEDQDHAILINRGGARSTKSYSITQLISERFGNCTNRKILILRKTLPSLKLSTYKVFMDMWKEWGLFPGRIQEKKMSLDYYLGSNWIHFGSLDDPEKIKSTDWNDIMMEEANEFTYDDFSQLRLRMSTDPHPGDPINQMFMLLNPVDENHWIKTKVVDVEPEARDIHSSFLDNPFLSPAYKKLLRGLEKTDPNKWKIYGLGEWGSLENVIYPNWTSVDRMPNPELVDETFYGLDFGFNAPSALVKIQLVDMVPYEEQILYQSGLTNTDLIDEIKKLKISENDPIYCDNAEPDRIEEIRRAGFNAMPADKARAPGIDFCQSLNPNILKSSTELVKEIRGYSWKQDKNMVVLDEPVKFNDHLMDARRYAYYSHIGKRADFSIRWL